MFILADIYILSVFTEKRNVVDIPITTLAHATLMTSK